jgi:uncharacterized integral membrane protein
VNKKTVRILIVALIVIILIAIIIRATTTVEYGHGQWHLNETIK